MRDDSSAQNSRNFVSLLINFMYSFEPKIETSVTTLKFTYSDSAPAWACWGRILRSSIRIGGPYIWCPEIHHVVPPLMSAVSTASLTWKFGGSCCIHPSLESKPSRKWIIIISIYSTTQLQRHLTLHKPPYLCSKAPTCTSFFFQYEWMVMNF